MKKIGEKKTLWKQKLLRKTSLKGELFEKTAPLKKNSSEKKKKLKQMSEKIPLKKKNPRKNNPLEQTTPFLKLK